MLQSHNLDVRSNRSIDELAQSMQIKTVRTNASQIQNSYELIEIDQDLFGRLMKTDVIQVSPNIKTFIDRQTVQLDVANSQQFLNGILFANYLIALRDVLTTFNMDFSVKDKFLDSLKDQSSAQARLFNWNKICNELDKMGVIVENDIKSLYVAGDSEEIYQLFKRVERYATRMTGNSNILLFEGYQPKNKRKLNKSPFTEEKRQDIITASGRMDLQRTHQQQRDVKDGVDIIQMDMNREPSETDSPLEFILNTLCRSLNMKPKQAAALLTNNNQFLIHCVVKGVKSKFEPIISWYQEVYQYSRHLSMMLEVDHQNSVQQKDPKILKACHQNFDKVLQTMSCGCYSNNETVAQLCLKTLSCIAQDISSDIDLVELSMKWFSSKENGIYTINYAFKKHPSLAEDYVTCIGNFTGAGEQMSWVYTNTMLEFYPNQIDYFNCLNDLFPYLTLKYSESMINGNLLDKLIEKCVRYSDQDIQNSPQLRVAALGLLNEIWLSFSNQISNQEQYINSIQHVFKKAARDKIRMVRIVGSAFLFKLLDKFADEKNVSAPAIYRQLIFALVESPQDVSIREMYLNNFLQLFDKVKSIPIGLLIEPLAKLSLQREVYPFQTIDYDFFTQVAQHPKLNVQNAIQILDLLAKQYLTDICNATAASVPFIMLCSKFLWTLECQEFIMKFITICLNQLLQLEKQSNALDRDRDHTPNDTRKKQLAIAATASNRTSSENGSKQGGKEFRISSSKKKNNKAQLMNRMQSQEEIVNLKLKKSYIITILLKIQNLRQDDVNNAMREMLLGSQMQYREQKGILHGGITAVLKYWGDSDQMFKEYLAIHDKQPKNEGEFEDRMLEYDIDDNNTVDDAKTNNNMQLQQSSQALTRAKSQKSVKKPQIKRNTLALVPITQADSKNARAIREIEKIKKSKKDREEAQKIQQQLLLKKQNLMNRRAHDQVMQRRIELGVNEYKGGQKQEIKALIYKEDEAPKVLKKQSVNPLKKQIQLIDMNEEEDRDREIITSFMKKYSKIWKYLFRKYSNQGYSSMPKQNFDELSKKLSQITLPEVIKMMRDHDVYPQLVKKDEVQQLIRLINIQQANESSKELTMLDYPQFLSFIVQVSLLAFSRPPVDKSSQLPIESLRTMLYQFEKATRDRGKSTTLYEDPDQSVFTDKDLVEALEQKVIEDPSYPLPEGFRKVVEKVPHYKFEVPWPMQQVMKESKLIAVETMDDILNDIFGIHFLEPLIKFENKLKVKPTINRNKKGPTEALGYMKKVERKIDEAKDKQSKPPIIPSSQERKRNQQEIKPKINLALKMQVTKQDLKDRPHYQDVAEVIEEMMGALENGLDYLPPRQIRAPGHIHNEVKQIREAQQEEYFIQQLQKEQKRKERDQQLKKMMKDKMPAKVYKHMKLEVEKKQQEIEKLQEKKQFLKKVKEQKERVKKIKEKKEEEEKKKKEEEDKLLEVEKQKAKEKNAKFLKEKKQKIEEELRQQRERRETVIKMQEEQKAMQKQAEENLKKNVQEYIKESKEDRLVYKKEREDIIAFLETSQVQDLFDRYDLQLRHLFKYYASQDNSKQKSFNLEFQQSILSQAEFTKFGHQQQIAPNLITTEELVTVYKQLISEKNDIDNKNKEQDAEYDINHNTSGHADYPMFKKAIVRISILSQEKLGGSNEQVFKEVKQKQEELDAQNQKQKEQLKQFLNKQEEQKKERIQKLREKFFKERKEIQDKIQAQVHEAKQQKTEFTGYQGPERRQTVVAANRDKEWKREQALIKAQQDEEDFKQWLKRRENLGLQDDEDLSSHKPQRLTEKKDIKMKELEDLKKQQLLAAKVKNLKIEKAKYKVQDVSTITVDTIDNFIKYIGLTETDNEHDINKKLNNNLLQRKTLVKRVQNDKENAPSIHQSPTILKE